jgi:hypothetical protein
MIEGAMMVYPSIVVTHIPRCHKSYIEIDNNYNGLFNIISALEEKYNEEKEEYRGKVGITVGEDRTEVVCEMDWGDIAHAVESSKDSGGHEQPLARVRFDGDIYFGQKYFVF